MQSLELAKVPWQRRPNVSGPVRQSPLAPGRTPRAAREDKAPPGRRAIPSTAIAGDFGAGNATLIGLLPHESTRRRLAFSPGDLGGNASSPIDALDGASFRRWAATRPATIIRATGTVRISQHPAYRCQRQRVGARWRLVRHCAWGDDIPTTRVVLVGHSERGVPTPNASYVAPAAAARERWWS